MRHNCRLNTVDLFAGSGGLSLGFLKAGFNIVAAYENWGPAIATYTTNLPHPVYPLDLSDSKASSDHILRHHKPDVIVGGPPCQDFSLANNRKSTTRANLTIEFARIVARVEPALFVMENVYTIERSEHLSRALRIFKRAGYGLTQRVIDASRIGVPQMRQRYFLIGYKDTENDFFGHWLDSGLSKNRTTVRDYLGDALKLEHYYAHPRTYQRRAVFSIDEPAATIRRVNRPIPATYKRHPADKCAVGPNLRRLTTEERALLQTFPADFKFLGTNAQREQQIGNAVPVLLAEYVACTIKRALKDISGKRRQPKHDLLVE